MKKSFLFIAIFICTFCNAQITEEHFYPLGKVNRIVLENSGEKYYTADIPNTTIHFFNADHGFWKDVVVPVT